MRKINIDKIKPGTLNGKAIYSFSNKQRLLNKGVHIKAEFIKRLKSLGIGYIYVEDELSEGIKLDEMIRDDLQYNAKSTISEASNFVKNDRPIENTKALTKTVNKIVDEIFSSSEIMVNMTDIRTADDYTFGHSVNVCTLSIILGIELGLNQLELRDLGIGGIMHDIGKTKIPLDILNKSDKLTDEEMEIIKGHPQEGFEILRKCDSLNRNSVYVALGHHERYDGTGYPNGFTNEQTHKYARIVGIVDVFDAMSSDRVYRKGIEVNKVIEYMKFMSNKQFDGEIVDKFINKINIYPNTTGVILNTNERAIVVSSNYANMQRPVVRIFLDPNGVRYPILREVDLSSNEEYFIIGKFDDF